VTEISASSGRFSIDEGDPPDVGQKYVLEDAANATSAQNRAFHALLMVYWKSGAWSYEGSGYRPGMTYTEFRDHVKRYLGAGFESYFVAELVEVIPGHKDIRVNVYASWKKVPKHVRDDPNKGNYCRGRLKSWSDYTKKERRLTLDRLITEMHQVGVNGPDFDRILKGMEDATQRKV
jgi:hypothetical protein